MSAPILTQAIVKRLLNYELETGQFTWRERADVRRSWNTRYAGKRAGYAWKAGPNVTYWCVRIFDWPFLGHRLAWLYVTGSWPKPQADHRDLNGLNNAWSNLREADKAQNGANTAKPRTNTTGFKGVSLDGRGRYRATIRVGGRQKWLGYFATAEEAHAAYVAAARVRSGDFARAS